MCELCQSVCDYVKVCVNKVCIACEQRVKSAKEQSVCELR